MDLEPAFLADMAAQPLSATPWLVFADWLEERGDPRGELVRLLRLCWDDPRKRVFKERHARLQELFAAGLHLPLPRVSNHLGMEFVWVPPGHFWMGGGNGKAGQRYVETALPFWMGVHPVSQGQWQTLLGDNPSWFSRTGPGAEQVGDRADNDLALFPVESVSWEDAQRFVAALNHKEGSGGWTYRLPTEEEWEYAARSPVACLEDCAFSFYLASPSNRLSFEQATFIEPPSAAHTEGRSLGRTTTVGAYRPNHLGIHDLHGNVAPWTETAAGPYRVARGGCWAYPAANCTAARDLSVPESRRNTLGLRLARVLS
jgi:uncharacterized protein (TIGR02996 family)